jgi:hypothetical protein
MYKSKLIEIFSSLAPTEQRALGKFVRSPYHNRREDVIELYDYIYHHRDLEDRNALKKEEVFKVLFPKKKFDADQIDYIMSFLLKLIEQFLMIESLMQDKIQAQMRLSASYLERRLDKHFNQAWRYANRLQKQQPLRDSNYFRRAYHLEYQRYSYSAGKKRNEAKNLQQLTDSFDAYFIAERLKQACLMLAHKAVYKTEYSMELPNQLLAYLQNHLDWLEQYPALGLYYYYYATLNTENLEDSEESFQKFKDLFFNSITALPEDEIADLYLFSINYCIRRSNTGSPEYIRQLLDFYKLGLENDILIKQGRLSPSSFKNISKAAMKIEDYEWTYQFIEKYQHYLSPEHREAYVHYAWGEYYYKKSDYQEAMLHLQQIEHSDIFMNLSARVILMKIYYELSEIDALEALINSMKAYLSRKIQLGYHRQNYKNIVSLMRKLMMHNPYSKKEVAKLRKAVEEETPLTEKKWFLEQLA